MREVLKVANLVRYLAEIGLTEINRDESLATLGECPQSIVRELFAPVNIDTREYIAVARNGVDRLVREFIAFRHSNKHKSLATLGECTQSIVRELFAPVNIDT
jgi:hypothetical protein